ncbi:MAG: 1-(5-phosphoribosyl)-5-[(5-phosphoribosylamino)methylideneamino] imidazole-4-carboxamide isomerase [Candidatus Micrarchaeota archaeon]|nr:1-(5-phosphoribosyl)-5-[(5-phosphoribosylamino)methylideneamino] imidazole-4-carboxamide isomerase [Candidatus Micrarchaeota archaeon]
MRVIPSIDIMDGKCVRLVRGEKSSSIAYEKSPLETAEEYDKYGAKLIHIVDLDGAFIGDMKNLELIKQIAKRFPIQVGGGIRDERKIEQLLALGVQKVVVSTLLLKDQDLASKIKEKYYGKLVGSFDFNQGRLSYAGWVKQSNISFENAVTGLEEVIVTDIERDGTFNGPNLDLLRSLKIRCKSKMISAGGVKDILNIFELRKIGMDGVIIGKAFLENKINLKDGFRFEGLAGD